MAKLSGEQVYEQLEREHSSYKRQEESLNKTLSAHENELDSLEDERQKILEALATLYVPELSQKAIADLRQGRKEMQGIFEEKQRARQKLEENIAKKENEKEGLEEQLKFTSSRLSLQNEEVIVLKTKVSEVLQEKPEYKALLANANDEKARLDAHEQNAKHVQRLAADNLPAYEKNRFFRYLQSREYGTKKYDGNPIVRIGDKWVSALFQRISYAELCRNYEFLNTMPEKMQKEVQKRKEALSELLRSIETIEEDVSGQIGLTAATKKYVIAEKTKAGIWEKIEECTTAIKGYSAEKDCLYSGNDEYLKKAKKAYTSILDSKGLNQLKKMALETPSPEDDKLVEKLENLDNKIDAKKKQIEETKESVQQYSVKKAAIAELQKDFTRKNYEISRSKFDGLDVAALLTGFSAGKMTKAAIWNELSEKQSFVPEKVYSPPVSSYRSNYSDSHHRSHSNYSDTHYRSHSNYSDTHCRSHSNYSNSHSNSWDGGFSSGGGFGGGGFSTTGGF